MRLWLLVLLAAILSFVAGCATVDEEDDDRPWNEELRGRMIDPDERE